MKKFILFILGISLIWACNSYKKLNVSPIDEIYEPVSNQIIYILPKTEILISVEVYKIVENKAPFAQYTEKYLGSLKNIIKENRTYWEISDVEFFTVPQVDTTQIYVISSKKNNLSDYINLTKEGFLVSINKQIDFQRTDIPKLNSQQPQIGTKELSFASISLDKTYKEIYDTIYKKEIYDTVFKLVPIIKKSVIRKSTEEQAEELAEAIFTLRDDRAALLVGNGYSDYLPDGEALEIMLKNLDKLEADYLSMFVGRRDTLVYHYIFSYIPEKNNLSDTALFKFSKQKGVLPLSSFEGDSVFLQLKTQNYTKKFDTFKQQQQYYNKKQKTVGLYYRLPERATVKLLYNNSLLGQKDVYIAQLGTVLTLPKRLLKNKKIYIEFYPELGALKSISQK